jgi:hypothetical protein
MKIAIMQPYFFPYIGYFQLINAVDEFVIYDNIEFTKKGWINRNRILVNDIDSYISVPLKKDSDYLHINERILADTWIIERQKILNRVSESYKKAPFFNEAILCFEKCLMYDERNLFDFILHSIQVLMSLLNIETKLIISSNVPIDHKLKSTDKIIAICKQRGADAYINAIGGFDLYNKEFFMNNNLELKFQKSNSLKYKQFNNEFIPWLSIIDVMMFNDKSTISKYLNSYTLN